jgi:hypothetical protein
MQTIKTMWKAIFQNKLTIYKANLPSYVQKILKSRCYEDLSRRLRLKCHPKMAAWERLIGFYGPSCMHACMHACMYRILYYIGYRNEKVYTYLANDNVLSIYTYNSNTKVKYRARKNRIMAKLLKPAKWN